MRTQLFSRRSLKLLAAVSMIVDHIGAVFFPQTLWLRWIGRLAFPLYAFFLAEGMKYTKNRENYFSRLILLGLISEIFFDAMFGRRWEKQNVLWTLALGGLSILALEKSYTQPLWIFSAILPALLAQICRTDYGAFGVCLCVWYYQVGDRRLLCAAGQALLCVAMGYRMEVLGVVSTLLLCFYDSKRPGKDSRLFYLVYPLHMAIFWAISALF